VWCCRPPRRPSRPRKAPECIPPNSPVTMDDLVAELQDNTDPSECTRRADRRKAAVVWIGNAIKSGVIALDGDNLVLTLDGNMPPVSEGVAP
jgi:hypothetical protein